MKNAYLLSKKARIIVACLWLISLLYLLASHDWNPLGSLDNFHRPISQMVLITLFLYWLIKIKKTNWKNDLRLYILCLGLTIAFFTTYVQLSAYFNFTSDLIYNSELNLGSEAIKTAIDSRHAYRIGKILLFDVFVIIGMTFGFKYIEKYED